MGIVGEILIAEQHAVLIDSRGEQTDAPFKVVIHADAHGGSMPKIPEGIFDGAAVSCAGNKAPGLAGIGIALLQYKGAKGRIRHINTVGIGVVLCSGAGILQVVCSADFVHERPPQCRAYPRRET